MPNCFQFEVPGHEGFRYRFDLDWLEDEFIDAGQLATEIRVTRIWPDGEHQETITASVALDLEAQNLTIILPDGTNHTIDLERADHLADEHPAPGHENEGPEYLDAIANAGDQAEAFINAIPAPDPFVSCLLRAGIATTVGQIISCNTNVDRGASLGERARAIVLCLRRNAPRMAWRTLTRTGRCVITAGIF